MAIDSAPREVLIAEYQAASDAYIHYDGFSWQVAGPLFTGVAVFWGFLVQRDVSPSTVGVSGALIALLLTTWLLYADHNRQIYLLKLLRIHELEAELGMWQHRQWTEAAEREGRVRFRTFGMHGHTLNKTIYAAASLGASAIGSASGRWSWWLLLPLPIVVIALLAIRRGQRQLSELRAEADQRAAATLRPMAQTARAETSRNPLDPAQDTPSSVGQ